MQVREHCLSQLSRALEENSRVEGASTTLRAGLEEVAVDLEYGIFLGVKSVQVYKLTVHKKVRLTLCMYDYRSQQCELSSLSLRLQRSTSALKSTNCTRV